MLHVTEETRAGWHVVIPRGRVDNLTADDLAAVLRAAVAAHLHVAVDCAGVDYLSSSGLGALLEGARAAHDANREFRVCAPAARVRQIFELNRLNHILNVQEALPC